MTRWPARCIEHCRSPGDPLRFELGEQFVSEWGVIGVVRWRTLHRIVGAAGTIIMTTTTAEWREFEVLVSRIEEWLTPKGAVVKSPDSLPDKITGEQRNVDATVRFQVGSAPILIAIECRKRKHKEDVTWIEQLAQKKCSIGADKMIAVSSTGFSAPAIRKAERLGIELRHVSEVTEQDIGLWAHKTVIRVRYLHWNLVSLGLRTDPPGIKLAPEIKEALEKDPINTRIGYEKASNLPLTAGTMFDHCTRRGTGIADDLQIGASPARRTITADVPKSMFSLFSTHGEVNLRRLEMTVDMWMTEETPVPRVLAYRNLDGTSLIQVAEIAIPKGRDGSMTLLYSQTPPSAGIPKSQEGRES